MTRMGREFSLVLLGAGILTAGYFIAPSPEAELEKKADEQAAGRVAGHQARHASGFHYMPLIWLHSAGYAGSSTGRPATATAGIARGGFGGIGHSASAVS